MNSALPSLAAVPDEGDSVSAAFADVVEALQESTAARMEQMEVRMLAKANGAVRIALQWGAGIAAAVVGWTCAHVALGLWLSARYDGVTALVVATVIHAAIALCLFAAAIARTLSEARTLAHANANAGVSS